MPCLPHPRVSFRLALGVCALTCIAQAHAQCISDLQTFEYTGAIETYTVPTTGTFWLQAAGAEGETMQVRTFRPGVEPLSGAVLL